MSEDWAVRVKGETTAVEMDSPGMQVLEGDLSTEYGAVLEKLSTPGVNSYRYREIGRELKPLRLLLNEDGTQTRDIYLIETLYQNAEGNLVSLTVNILGVMVRWKHVMVEQVQILGRDGPLYGRGAKSGSKHCVWSAWTFMREREGEILG